MTPEGKVKLRVRKLLDNYPHYRFMPVQTGYGSSTLDFLICYNGKFLAIETKRFGKVPTPLQERIIEKIKGVGGTVFVVSGDEGLAQLELWLGENKNAQSDG